jgi:hypothetical protein
MTAGHFVFIPAVLVIGIVIGWILGSRAAADAYAAELKRREERAAKLRAREEDARMPESAGARHGASGHEIRRAPVASDPARDESPVPPEVRR